MNVFVQFSVVFKLQQLFPVSKLRCQRRNGLGDCVGKVPSILHPGPKFYPFVWPNIYKGLFGTRFLVGISGDNIQTSNPHLSPIHVWC
jgi:hypothetical protein